MKRNYPLLVLITCCTCWLSLINIALANTSPDCINHVFSTSISDPNHDVEELPEGFIMTISPSLELVHNQWVGHQPVGLRFEGIALPPDAEIVSAYLQFTTNQTNIETCELYIEGELALDPSPFFSQLFDLTLRQKTNSKIDWSPLPWMILGESSAPQRTPDISSILNEIISQENWKSESPITLFLNGIGRRPASSFDYNPNQAPRLIIEINIPKANTPYQGVVINELMAANGIYPDEFEETDDWVEIYNGGTDTISLGNLYLSDDEDRLDKWMIPSAKKLAPGSLLTIWLDNQITQGALHAPFKLNKEGEYLALTQKIDDQFIILDEIEFPSLALNVSYGRVTDGQNDWVKFIKPSRGSSNDFNKLLANLNIEFSIPGGVYEDSLLLSLSANHPNASIYYTLDGSSPTRSSLLYDAPILLDSSRLISARAFIPDHSGYRPCNEFYIINENHQLPIISIQTEPDNLWDDQKGIYTVGSNGIIGHCKSTPFNWNQDWERPAQVAFFEEDGSKAFQVNAGIKIAGGCSRQQKMKSLNLFCRTNEYGDKQINYKIFPDLDIDQFKRLKIRNGGQDFAQLSFRDGVNQQLLYEHLDIDLMGYRPAILYLNGEYWGIYGIREFYNTDYITTHHQVANNPLDILYNPLGIPYNVKEGTYHSYHALRTFIKDNDISQQDNYNYIKSKIDLQEYIDYHIAQIYLSNADWPDRNVTIWKEQNDGKWRWLMYDTDITTNMGAGSASLSSENSLLRSLNTSGSIRPYPSGTLFFRQLMENNDFKNEFIQRSCTYRTLVFNPDRVHTFADDIQEKLLPEIPRHISKWRPSSELGNGTPMGGHIDNWENYIDNYKSFFVERQDFIFNHYQTTLDLDHTFSLNYNHNDTTHGKIYIHENDLPVSIGFQAEYFANIPIKIKAVADSMYTFLHWEETLDTNAITTFQSSINTTLTPIFTRILLDTIELIEPDVDTINIDTMPPDLLPFSLNIHPNPMRDQLSIYYHHPETEPLSIEIINILGQSIADFTLEPTLNIQQKNIAVDNWTNGIYFLLVKKEPSLIFKILKK